MTTKLNVRRRILPLIVFILIILPGLRAAEVDAPQAEAVVSALETYYGPGVDQSRTYVGSEICLACHPDQDQWRTSMHATGFKITSTDAFSMQDKFGVVVDYDGNGVDDFKQGLDFNQISSVFDKYKPNAPVLGYDENRGYTFTIGQVTHDSRFAYGGSGLYKQRFVVKIPTVDGPGGYGKGHYVGPIQYNEVTSEYVAYHPEDWWAADGTPHFTPATTMSDAGAKGRSFDKKCSGCHFTGLAVSKSAEGEWTAAAPPAILPFPESPHYYDMNGDGLPEEINTGCERCHGPGSRHVLNRGDPEKIINPNSDLTTTQANQICGGCHSRGKSLPDGVHDFPYDETTNEPYAFNLGEELYDRFWRDSHGLWPDGKSSRQHHQQYQDFLNAHKEGMEFDEGVRCFDCHDVHVDNLKHIRPVMTVQGTDGGEVAIQTKMEDNSMCLACHAGFEPFEALKREDIVDIDANLDRIASAVEQHSFHSYNPDRTVGLSRCTECHMGHLAKSAVAYDIPAHTFEVVPPSRTLAYLDQGSMPNSCAARCHRPLAPLFGLPQDDSLTNWTEPSDIRLAEWLKIFYGPDGIWWKETVDAPGGPGGESDSGQ